jgi:hypothetical protein
MTEIEEKKKNTRKDEESLCLAVVQRTTEMEKHTVPDL